MQPQKSKAKHTWMRICGTECMQLTYFRINSGITFIISQRYRTPYNVSMEAILKNRNWLFLPWKDKWTIQLRLFQCILYWSQFCLVDGMQNFLAFGGIELHCLTKQIWSIIAEFVMLLERTAINISSVMHVQYIHSTVMKGNINGDIQGDSCSPLSL